MVHPEQPPTCWSRTLASFLTSNLKLTPLAVLRYSCGRSKGGFNYLRAAGADRGENSRHTGASDPMASGSTRDLGYLALWRRRKRQGALGNLPHRLIGLATWSIQHDRIGRPASSMLRRSFIEAVDV